MLHIKDIEAFARINEALARNEPPAAAHPNAPSAAPPSAAGLSRPHSRFAVNPAAAAFARLASGLMRPPLPPPWPTARPDAATPPAETAPPIRADAGPAGKAQEEEEGAGQVDAGQICGPVYDFDLLGRRQAVPRPPDIRSPDTRPLGPAALMMRMLFGRR